MNQIEQDVIEHLGLVSSNRALIAQAYACGGVDLTPENAKAIRQLQLVRAMRPNPLREDSFRLSPTLVKYLDEVTQKARNFSVSANFGEQMERILNLKDEYSRAHYEGREEDRDNYLSEFDAAVYETSEAMSDFLLHVRTQVDNNFANVSTYSEKIKQNEHYLNQMDRLREGLKSLNDDQLWRNLNEWPELELLNSIYQKSVGDRLSQWHSILSEITTVLKAYLSRLRTIEPRARRIRTMKMFLHKHPEYEPGDPDSYGELPPWAYQHAPIAIRLMPDLSRDSICEALVPVARTIERKDVGEIKVRQTGQVIIEDAPAPEVIQVSPIILVSNRFLKAAGQSEQKLSALEFIRQARETRDLDHRVCLVCLVSLLQNHEVARSHLIRGLKIEHKVRPDPSNRSGNVLVEDVYACAI